MGLLGRLARGVRSASAPYGGVGNALGTDAAVGGIGGGLTGAALNPDDPMSGAMSGAALGAGGFAGIRAARMAPSIGRSMQGLRGAEFQTQKEALAARIMQGVGPEDMPRAEQAAQMIRNARDEMDLEDVMGRIQSPQFWHGGGTVQRGADFGMRPPQDDWGR